MERARARDLVVGAEANRRLSTDSSMVAERAPCWRGTSMSFRVFQSACRRGTSMSFRVCQSGREEEEAMADTVSSMGEESDLESYCAHAHSVPRV